MMKPKKAPKLGQDRFRTSKSIIEQDDNGLVTRIILRDYLWPYYKGSRVGNEWIFSGDTIQITRADKKLGFINTVVNLSDVELLDIKKPSNISYIGQISLKMKSPHSRLISYNQFDCLVALAAGEYISEQCQESIVNGSLTVKIDQILIDMQALLKAGDSETVALVKRRKMPHVMTQAKPPIIKPTPDPATRIEYLKSLKELLDSDVLTQEEFDAEKAKILNP